MRLLLDTHAFLWFITADPRLSATGEQAIRRSGDTPPMAIKVQLQRLPIPEPLDTFIPEQLRINRIGLLPIELPHTFEIARLPLHHRDPFDRILIAQAMRENIPIVSADSAFDVYPIQRLW